MKVKATSSLSVYIPVSEESETEPANPERAIAEGFGDFAAQEKAARLRETRARKRKARKTRQRNLAVASVVLGVILLVSGFFFSPDPVNGVFRNAVGDSISQYFVRVQQRAARGHDTFFDRFVVGVTFKAVVYGGWASHPEGSAVWRHYMHGDGSDLKVSSAYVRRATALRVAIAGKGAGEYYVTPGALRAHPRVSMAFPDCRLRISRRNGKDFYRIHSNIAFPVKGSSTVSKHGIGKFAFELPKSLIWMVCTTCEPFRVWTDWEKNEGKRWGTG